MKESPVHKVARFIVDKRTAFFILFFIAVVYCASSISKVKLNEDITAYLPEGTETLVGIEIMQNEFTTVASAQIMLSNVTFATAESLAGQIENISGVSSVAFDGTEEHYTGSAALFSVAFEEDSASPLSGAAMAEIKELLHGYDTYTSSYIGTDLNATIQREMTIILAIAVAVIIAVLLFTSRSYLEVAVFFIIFPVAAVLNMGTNYLFGEVSFITNSIAIILQLALAIDYSIILCHRFMEELETKPAYDAAVDALSKAIIEISSSSLTTIAGLFALTLMQFKLGQDMGQVLIKGIVCSLITVFLLMPGVLMLFSRGIQKTRHRSFVPSIRGWGRLVVKLRYVLPVIFFIAVAGGIYFSGQSRYVFTENAIDTNNPSENQIAAIKISETFGRDNVIAVLVPRGSYEHERLVLERAGELPDIKSATGLASISITDDYMLTDDLTPRQLAEMTGVDIELVRLLYQAYGLSNEEYGAIFQETDKYSVPLVDIFMFLCEQKNAGVVNLDDKELSRRIDEMYDLLTMAKQQLAGENWSRLVFTTGLPEEGDESFALLDSIRAVAAEYYGEEVILVGNTTSARDLSDSFEGDNRLISALTVVFVLIILLFTFRSAGLPVLLVLTIQGSIWINFSFPYLTGSSLFFIAYLIVSSIQMGATIDYAIVITNRYLELKKELPNREAVIEALNQSFATVFTSGSIMTIAGFLVAELTTYGIISSLGMALGRGTLISIILVLTVLPTLLLLGDTLIEKTMFTLSRDRNRRVSRDIIRVDGHIKGHVSGYVDAEIKGVVRGSLDAQIESRKQESEDNIDED